MGEWMYPTDERVLEHLSEETWASPSTMEAEPEFCQLNVDAEYIRQRCNCMVDRELIVPILEDGDLYEITRWGQAYLRGDLHADSLQKW